MPNDFYLVMRLHSIGLICISWSYLENLTAVCFGALTDWEEDYWKTLVSGRDFQRLYQWLCILAPRKLPAKDVVILRGLQSRIEEASSERNLAVHGQWETTDSPAKILVTNSRGKYKNIPQEMTEERMNGVVKEIDEITEIISSIFENHGLIHFGEDDLLDDSSST